ncbi:MAG: GtrA family protein, partial [Clostridia bacterium]|nr:GtrA family protein [Clostridia bacterium]
FVGCLNTLVSIVVANVILLLFGYPIFSGKNDVPLYVYLVATVSGDAVGVVHSYIWNKFFTFKSRGRSVMEILRFLLVDMVRFGLKFALVALFDLFISVPFIVTALASVICVVVSYFGHNFFSFAKRFTKKEEQSLGNNDGQEGGDPQ